MEKIKTHSEPKKCTPGTIAIIFRFDGAQTKAEIIKETDNALLFRDLDPQSKKIAWMPKWIWNQEYYFSVPLNCITIRVPRHHTLVWKTQER